MDELQLKCKMKNTFKTSSGQLIGRFIFSMQFKRCHHDRVYTYENGCFSWFFLSPFELGKAFQIVFSAFDVFVSVYSLHLDLLTYSSKRIVLHSMLWNVAFFWVALCEVTKNTFIFMLKEAILDNCHHCHLAWTFDQRRTQLK